MLVHVLLYEAGTESEGIHSLELKGRTVILMFQNRDDAERYCGLLEAQDFPTPSVEELTRVDIESFCVEAGYDSEKFYIDDESPNYYHPGKSGRVFLNKGKDKVAAYFGEIHPNIIKTLDIKTESLVGFEIFLDNLKLPKKPLKDQKTKYSVSDFQKSERDFAFIVDRKVNVQDLVSVISNIDKNLISNIKVFDVYEGDNIPENQKSIAISVTIQSSEKTLTDNDLEKINNLIIETVENKTGAKIRS